MTLQKLVHRETLVEREEYQDASGGFFSNLFRLGDAKEHASEFIDRHTNAAPLRRRSELRTIQRYFGAPNHERADYMERHSALAKKNLMVSAEQVSLFHTGGKTIYIIYAGNLLTSHR